MEELQTKTEIREFMLKKRLSLSDEAVSILSTQIDARLLKSPLWKSTETLGLYAATKNEVSTSDIFQKALEQGKTVYFPRVEQGIKYYEVNDPSDLEKGAWGILEPKAHCAPLTQESEIDLLLVPGVAFDKLGHRLGFGRGFYDSILPTFKLTVGLAYEFQVLEALPVDSWDKQVHLVLTEKAEYGSLKAKGLS